MGSARHPRLTRIAGVARALGLSLVPGLSVVAADLALRRSLLTAFTPAAVVDYVASAAAGTVAWAALVVAAAHRASPTRWVARGALAALAVLAVGTQLEAWDRYGAYLNWRTALMGCSLWPCLAQELLADRARTFALLLAPAAVALGVAAWLQRAAPPGRLAGTAALPLGLLLVALAAALGKPDAGWDSGATPDVLWLNAVASLVKSKRSHEDIMVELRWLPAGRTPDPLPALHASPARSRSVLLVLDESVRASDVCSVISHDGQDGHEGHGGPDGHACDESPFTNALLRGRFGFTAMRSVDSTTTLSLAALMTGLSPAEPRARLLSAPMLPEVAHAAGLDAAFWTGQNLLFANTGRFLDGLPLAAFVSGTELAPYATYETGADDGALLDRVLSDAPRLRRPFLGVAQLSNTHFPYVVDDRDLPFSSHLDWRSMDTFGQARVRYRDAVHRQDRILARFIAALRARPEGAQTVIVFLSDHGEQFGERGRIGHTFTGYDEELRVPMWIDAPPGTLTDGEAAQLRALRDTPLAMLDVAPTILDLLGLWDDPALGNVRSRMTGVSLLRGGPPRDRAVVVTNCSEIYSCAERNWGAMRGPRKLIANDQEGGPWRCFDLATDPAEHHDLGPAACGDLQTIAEASGRGTPY